MTLLSLSLVGIGFPTDSVRAQGTAYGEIEQRPAPVARRMCIAGPSAGALCNEDADCSGAPCRDRNVFNLSVAVHYDAPEADLTAIEDMVSAGSAMLFDVLDGQAEIGQATIHNNAAGGGRADIRVYPANCTAGSAIGTACATHADCPPSPGDPGRCGVWWKADTGSWKVGGSSHVSINWIDAAADTGPFIAHELVHLIFDARDEYQSRPGCGAATGDADCPHAAAGHPECLMDSNQSELCWGQGDPADLTDTSGGDHDATNVTEQSQCRNNRSCWDQVVWSWPTTFKKPPGAPDPQAGGAAVNATKFVHTSEVARVVLVLDESYSMNSESPKRIERLKVAARDFVALAENDTEVGIISYATDAVPASGRVQLAVAPLGADRSAWNNAIDGLTPATRTNIGDGLFSALDLIVDAGGVTGNTYVVLMTDGRNNEPQPQTVADAHLDAAVAALLEAGVPVYVTCTGSDLGLPSQCAEIATGTGGHYTDSADSAALALAFADFHERIADHQAVGSFAGDLSKPQEGKSVKYVFGNSTVTSQYNTFYVEPGSQSASFLLQWTEPNANAQLTVQAPDGTVYETQPMSQGRFLRVDDPMPGDWMVYIASYQGIASPFLSRAYVRHPTNHLGVGVRYASVIPDAEIFVHAYPTNRGLAVTSDQSIEATVLRPDGDTDTLELHDRGRDASGKGDDVPGDGVFTGVYRATGTPGDYQFIVKAHIDDGWVVSGDAHEYQNSGSATRFSREVRVSTAVGDPNAVEPSPEDDRPTPVDVGEQDDDKTARLLRFILLLLVIIAVVLWFCCFGRRDHRLG
jgi:Mg-chelatase subunit ChlD